MRLSEGCNQLLADGAGVADSVEAVLSELQVFDKKQEPEKRILGRKKRLHLQAGKKWCIVVWIYNLKI